MASNFLPQVLQMYSKMGIASSRTPPCDVAKPPATAKLIHSLYGCAQPARRPMSSMEITSHPFARIANDFVPRRLLRGGNAQTLAGNFMKRANGLLEPEERLFQIEQDVQILCHCHWQLERQQRLTLMIVHGLEGSSNSRYVVGTGSRAW